MESVDENLIIDLIENQKLSCEQASSVLKEKSSWYARSFISVC